MKTYILFLAGVAAAALATVSCSKTDKSKEPVESGETVSISFGLCGDVKCSKANGVSAVETSVLDYQIFVFNKDGSLDISGYNDGNSPFPLICRTGEKRIYALVNSPDITSIVNSETGLKTAKSKLADNKYDKSFVMFGQTEATLLADTDILIPVDRICARITLGNITNKLPEAFGTLHVIGIYCANVAGDAMLGDNSYCPGNSGLWYNKTHRSASGNDNIDTLISESGYDSEMIIGSGTTASMPHCFYVYPNNCASLSYSGVWCPRQTRLVLTVSLDNDYDEYGEIIPYRYYAIDIAEAGDDGVSVTSGIERNHSYDISSLTITRLGSLKPEENIETGTVDFAISVRPWILGFEKDVEI